MAVRDLYVIRIMAPINFVIQAPCHFGVARNLHSSSHAQKPSGVLGKSGAAVACVAKSAVGTSRVTNIVVPHFGYSRSTR